MDETKTTMIEELEAKRQRLAPARQRRRRLVERVTVAVFMGLVLLAVVAVAAVTLFLLNKAGVYHSLLPGYDIGVVTAPRVGGTVRWTERVTTSHTDLYRSSGTG